jgi:glycerol-3-phosphate acyltransferase PlsY
MSLDPHATQERVRDPRAGLWRLAGPWWLLLTDIAWLIISVVVLRFKISSITTVGVLVGVVFLLAIFNEFLIASVRSSWRWDMAADNDSCAG